MARSTPFWLALLLPIVLFGSSTAAVADSNSCPGQATQPAEPPPCYPKCAYHFPILHRLNERKRNGWFDPGIPDRHPDVPNQIRHFSFPCPSADPAVLYSIPGVR
ncbi:MAG TPA: hypothetical protein VK395_03615 [Gemmataceae bacterium]|nr:hypothetical protein [Gemmataceae bacterium]